MVAWRVFLLFVFFMALLFKAKVVYIALYATAILYFSGGKLLEHGFTQLHVTRTAERTYLFPGETAQIRLEFENPSLMPFAWLSGYDRLPMQMSGGKLKRWVLSLGPRSKASSAYSVTGTRRGVYTAGPLEITAGDPLGLHQRSATVNSFHDVVVYPEVHPLHNLGLPSRLFFGNMKAQQRIYPDPSRLAGIRPYQGGDTWQSLHWKATARTGRLQVKQVEHTVALDTVLLVNMDEGDYSVHSLYVDSELTITTAAALANYLARAGEPFGFVTNAYLQHHRARESTSASPRPSEGVLDDANNVDDSREGSSRENQVMRIMPRKGIGQLMRVLEVLAASVCRSAPEFVSLVSNESRHFAWGATLLIVTPVDADKLVETGLFLASSGYQVMLFVTGGKVEHRQLLHRPGHASLQMFHVRQARDRSLMVGSGR